MTILSFFQYLKSGLEWAVNSKLIFAVISIFVCVLICRHTLGFIWRIIRDKLIFSREHRGDS